jgi:hypothetical protein
MKPMTTLCIETDCGAPVVSSAGMKTSDDRTRIL